jgi:tRNA nucleotidyltransferase (CCA-adding enzyme)
MTDYNFLMESRLSPEQFQVLSRVSRAAVDQGLNLYLVGGAVRDLTHGLQSVRDLDFVTDGNPQRLLRRLESGEPRSSLPAAVLPVAAGERVPLKIESLHFDQRLSSAEVRFSNGVRAEISMSRNEVYSKPGRPPEISPVMIFDDLKRRDLSVNAMAVSLHPNSRGLLLDPTNGAADIEKHELRVLHSRSFSEDSSRLYRLLRLGQRLGFKPEERTQQYLDAALENRVWERLEPAQQGRELRATLQEENPGRVLKMLAGRGLMAGLDKKLTRAKIPVERFAKIRAVSQTVAGADPYLLNFYCLVQNLPAGQKSRFAKKILGDAKTIHTALGMERAAKKLATTVAGSKHALPSRLYKLLAGQPQHLLLFLLAYYPNAKVQSRVKSFLHKFPLVRARLPRAELQAMGMKPGTKFEKIMDQVFLDQLDGKIKTHQQMIKELRELSGIKEPPPPPKPAKPPKAPKLAKVAKEPEQPSAPPPPPAKAAKAAKPVKRVVARAAPGAKKKAKPAKRAAPKKKRKEKKKRKK